MSGDVPLPGPLPLQKLFPRFIRSGKSRYAHVHIFGLTRLALLCYPALLPFNNSEAPEAETFLSFFPKPILRMLSLHGVNDGLCAAGSCETTEKRVRVHFIFE